MSGQLLLRMLSYPVVELWIRHPDLSAMLSLLVHVVANALAFASVQRDMSAVGHLFYYTIMVRFN